MTSSKPGDWPRIAKEAGELVAHYNALTGAIRSKDLAAAQLGREFVLRLAKARGETFSFTSVGSGPAYGRGMSLLVRSNRGHFEAYLSVNEVREQFALERVESGDLGFFARPEDWTDPRIVDHFLSSFCDPSTWVPVEFSRRALAAYVAQLTVNRSSSLAPDFESIIAGTGGGLSRSRILEMSRKRAREFIVEDRQPPLIPTRILGLRKPLGLGYGEMLAFWLFADAGGPAISSKQAAYILGISDSAQVRTMAKVAGQKLSGEKSLLRLVPPWPKGASKSLATKPHGASSNSVPVRSGKGGDANSEE